MTFVRWLHRGRWFLPAVLAIVALRIRYFFGTISTDEGGQFAIARAWNHGLVLYRDIWLDRPQGLLLLFRSLIWLGLGNLFGLRLMALALCLIGSAACGRIGARLGNERAAWISALAVGVLLSVPRMDGFPLNGEVASAPIGALALACLLRAVWKRPMPSKRWLFVGGVVGGCAFAVKQSAFDGFAVGVVIVGVLAIRVGWTKHDRLVAVPIVIAGFATSYGLVILHAALTGWNRWYFAVFGFRATKLGLFANAEWFRLRSTAKWVAPIIGVAIAVTLALAVWTVMRRQFAPTGVMSLWSLFAFAGFLLGGRFFIHYWLILVLPIGTALGVFVSLVPRAAIRSALFAASMALPVVFGIYGVANRAHEAESDSREVQDQRIAEWLEQNASPTDRVYAQCMSPGLYSQIASYPPFPYLWTRHITPIPSRREQLARLLEGRDAPRFIAVFEAPELCDPSGVMGHVLDTRYLKVATVSAVPIYELQAGR